ncbi:F-box/LRR-repeat protein [Trifolium repens]|nr:F-box/LRR-repeat protein [Trifolium repens]
MKRQRFCLKSCSQQFVDLPDDCWERIFSFLKNKGDDDDDNRFFDNLKSLSVVSKQFLSITNRHKLSLTILYQTTFHLPLPRLLQRFTNIISIDLSSYYGDLNLLLSQISCFPLNHLRSLNLSSQARIPAIGLRAFSKNITTLTSLNCSNIDTLNATDLKLIADCFPLLEELDISWPKCLVNNDYVSCYAGVEAISLSLLKLRKINLSRHDYINDELIFQLCNNCKFLEEAITVYCPLLTPGAASALSQRPTLRSIYFGCLHIRNPQHEVTSNFIDSILSLKGLTSIQFSAWRISDQLLSSIAMGSLPLRRLVLSNCSGYTYSGIFYLLSKCPRIQHLDLQSTPFLNNTCVADLSSLLPELVSINLSNCRMISHLALFTLARNCPSLTEINTEYTYFEKNSRDNPNFLKDRVVNPQLKYLSLATGFGVRNESIITLAAIFPNLQRLNLSQCLFITEEGIGQVLRSCPKIRHLDLSFCMKVKSLGIHFEVPKLEMLNLTSTIVDDEALCVISKRCRRLLQLVLQDCNDITTKGVMHVVKSCTQLKEIDLNSCCKVHATVVASMVLSRPSLRKIAPPRGFPLTHKNRNLFSRHGCFLER